MMEKDDFLEKEFDFKPAIFFGLLRKMKYMYSELQEKRIIGSIFLRRTKTTNIGILR